VMVVLSQIILPKIALLDYISYNNNDLVA
jgi:hypothetical protein